MGNDKPIIAVCGKGGVGKTAFSALLSRALKEAGVAPLLLIDADPAGGLISAVGERAAKTLAGVKEELVAAARGAGDAEKERLANQLDYLIMETLVERQGYSLLAMGRTGEKGCFCPANTLLREAIDAVSEPFALVLIDAEAGLEQINRQVTRRVTRTIVVTDGSARSIDTMKSIAEMIGAARMCAVANRTDEIEKIELPDGIELLGAIPEDETLQEYDRDGRPLWELPSGNPALDAARGIVEKLGLVTSAG
ncbi:MAG: AAA family ATPase [bacterium]